MKSLFVLVSLFSSLNALASVSAETLVDQLPQESVEIRATVPFFRAAHSQSYIQNGQVVRRAAFDVSKPACLPDDHHSVLGMKNAKLFETPVKMTSNALLPGAVWYLRFQSAYVWVDLVCNNPAGPLTLGDLQETLGSVASVTAVP